jgi:hypothetical protein
VEIAESRLLFMIPAGEFTAVTKTQDGTVLLQVKARSRDHPEWIIQPWVAPTPSGEVTILVRYDDPARRYGDRNRALGGDDWVRPSVSAVVKSIEDRADGMETGQGIDLEWDSFSTMNGGPFYAHCTHQEGDIVDGRFDDFSPNGDEAKAKQTAERIVELFNVSTHGQCIERILITHNAHFWQAIETQIPTGMWVDGVRTVTQVIQRREDHNDHFHLFITPGCLP